MKSRSDYALEFQRQLMAMTAEEIMSREIAELMVGTVADMLIRYSDELVEQMEIRQREWETKFGDDDKSFYSLGLRHAIDIVTGIDPTANSKATADAYLKELEGSSE